MHVRQSFKWQLTTLLVRSATGRTNSGFALACGHFSGIQIVPTNARVWCHDCK